MSKGKKLTQDYGQRIEAYNREQNNKDHKDHIQILQQQQAFSITEIRKI